MPNDCPSKLNLEPRHYVKMFSPMSRAEKILMKRRKRKEAIVKAIIYFAVMALSTWLASTSAMQTAIASSICLVWECSR